LDAYPASVRARRIAVAARHGGQVTQRELARACRAVLVKPELHLLGNHLLENGIGLLCGGAAADGREAELWSAVGRMILGWQLPEQFLGDGGHFERSASYHLALLAGLLEAYELDGTLGRSLPESWRCIIERAVRWVVSVRAPDGTYPLFNDSALDAAPDVDTVLEAAAALGMSTKTHAVSPRPWLRTLHDTGWHILGTDRVWIAVDAGPDGAPYQPGHAHADALTFELWLDGRRVIVDRGVAAYEGAARAESRATAAHNTVVFDSRDSCEVWAGFRVGRRSQGRTLAASRGDEVRLVLDHNGYAWLPGAPRHVRTIELGQRRLTIRDTIVGGSGTFASRLHLDREAADALTISDSPIPQADVWYPNHARPRPAVCFERNGRAERGDVVEWRLTW
jgi:uncharacterized heparinase superfamily protein